jgi:hypothetical protein
MVLYCLVGIEIVRRRRAIRAVSSGSVPLDDIVMAASQTSSSSFDNTVVMRGDFDVHSQPEQVLTSHSADESLISTSKYPIPNSRRHHLPQRPSLSFRQYILMPLFFFLALLSVWVAPTTNRVASFVNPSFSSYPLLLAVGTTGSLRGFWNGVVFITIGMKSWRRQKGLREGTRRRD